MEKKCSKCKVEPAPGSATWCKKCKKESQIAFYARCKKEGLCHDCGKPNDRDNRTLCSSCEAQISASRRKRRIDRKKKAIEFAGGKCVDCGLVTDVVDVYDFHHEDPSTKEHNMGNIIGVLFNSKFNWEQAKSELSKCVLLCSNCHRTRHYYEGWRQSA